MRTFADLYANKLMNITFTSNKGKEVFDNQIENHYPEDYGEVKKILKKHEVTTAFYIENINETCLDVPDGWIIIDAWGMPVGAGGKYEKFIVENYGVTELEETIIKDVNDVYAGKYDIVYALDSIDISDFKKEELKYEQAKKVYKMLMNAPRLEQELCAMAEVKYSGEIDELLNRLVKNAIEYAGVRARWSLISDEEAVRRNQERTDTHEIFIHCMTSVALYMKRQGLDTLADSMFCDCLSSRKQMGDLACYIAYRKAMEAREIIWE